MNHKVTLRSVFVVAVALGIAGVMVRMKDEPAVRRPAPGLASPDAKARALASYRVDEERIQGGMDYRGANFRARVSETGSSFGAVPEQGSRTAAREFTVEFGAPRIEQGAARPELEGGRFVRPAFGVAQVDRGCVVEEYVFENRRVEQLFRFPAPLGEGALRVAIPVTTDLSGPVVAHAPYRGEFMDPLFLKGGLAFCDAAGTTRFAYHTALVQDAAGRELALVPRHENGEIVLEVPAEFMAKAAYPVVVDPWLDFAGSGVGGGVSGNSSSSQKPVIALSPGGLFFVCWSDNSSATPSTPNNFDIYLKWWNGFEFKDLGGSSLAGGISNNTGKSVNPSMVLDNAQSPVIAWEDDTSGAVSIYLRRWAHRDEGGASWLEFSGSASSTGINGSLGPAQNPSVGSMLAVVPGVVTTDGNGVTTSTPPTFLTVAVVAWAGAAEAGRQIYCSFFYPGAPTQPISVPNPQGIAGTPPGWYPLGTPNGQGVSASLRFPFDSVSQTPTGSIAINPSLVIDSQNRVAVAWEDTRNGNFEIMLRRWSGAGAIQVAATNNNTQFDVLPAGDFVAVSTSFGAGGISATATPSQFPSLAWDFIGFTDNLTVAWQETLAGALPGPATTSQIYLRRSVNSGAWGALGTSAAGTGISGATGSASSPSLDVNGNYAGVAWADDANGRSSIYIRRFAIVGGAAWEQVGFQGSAFPAAFVGEVAPIGGISQSSDFSLQPNIKLDEFGSPTVAWSDGAGAAFDIRVKTFSPNAPGIASGIGGANPTFAITLRQTPEDPRTTPATPDIATADFSTGTSVFLSSRVFTETLTPAGTILRIEYEIQQSGAAFTNTPTHQALFVVPDSPTVTPANLAVLRFDGLPNANYHWQARTVDQIGRSSPWIQFATSGGVSFRINAAGGSSPPNVVPVAGNVGGSPSKGSCGLTGLEAVALLGAIALVRRRRAK